MIKNNSVIPDFPRLKELHYLISQALDVVVNFCVDTFNQRYSKFIKVNGKQYSPIKYVLHYEAQTPNTHLWREKILNKTKYYRVSADEVRERILKYGVLGIANMILYGLDYQRTNLFDVLDYTEENLINQIKSGPKGEETLSSFKFIPDKKFETPHYPYLSEVDHKKQLQYLQNNATNAMNTVIDNINMSSVRYIFVEQIKPNPNSKIRYHKTL